VDAACGLRKEKPVHHGIDDWGWFWMTFGAILWIVLLGSVVYVAVRLARLHDRRP
jgi:hypothetical protein